MINDDIISKLNFDDYEIILKSLNIENNIKDVPKNLTIGMNHQFLNKEKNGNDLFVPMALNILGGDGSNKTKEQLVENSLFKINIVYIVKFKMIDSNINIEEKEKIIERLAYFLVLPQMKEVVTSAGNKIGVPGLNIPVKCGFKKCQ